MSLVSSLMIPDRVFPDLVEDLYSNRKFEYLSLNIFVKGIEIYIHRYQFGIMFEFPFYGVSYTYYGPIKFKRIELSNYIVSFFMNHMDDMKLPIKVSYLKGENSCGTPFYHKDTPPEA